MSSEQPILAYGEINIVDLTDGKQIQAYLTSNQPNAVIYDPNNSSQPYTPNWSVNNLVLTPVITVDNQTIATTNSAISITWQRKVGSGSPSELITGETVSNGILTVSNNALSSISSGLLTYICSISYTDPDSSLVAETQVQMSFALVKNATELKDCVVTGDQTFKYNGEGLLVSAPTITLTATLTNTTLKQWQYKTSEGTFAAYPGASASTTLTVNATDNVFVNDTAVIKLVTNDNDIFDLHQIVKLRDGAAGENTYTCVLSNESQTVPADANGNLYEGSLNGCTTKITIYEGGNDDSENWSINATPSSGVTGSYDEESRIYTVTGFTIEAGYVEFICTKSGQATITKRFSVTKERSGADGADAVIYQIATDSDVLKLNQSNVFVPASITFSAQKRVGNQTTATAYSGRFKIEESTNGTSFTTKYTSSSDESSKTYTPSSTSVKLISCSMYAAGNTTTLLDKQTISIISDGKDGQQGDAGVDAVNVVLGNSSEVIPCDEDGKALGSKDITIPFSCYKGTTRIAGTASVGTLPSGVTLKTNTAATASAQGTIVLTVSNGATLASSNSGDITITITANSLSSTHKFTWTKNIKASSGENAVLLQLFAPQGDVILNGENTVLLQSTLTDGTNTVSNNVTYQWAKYTGLSYTNIPSQTASSLTVTADMVESIASFRCAATYKGKTYYAYWTVTDKEDEYSAYVFSTLGTQLVNGVGSGAIYVIVLQKGVEVDAMKSTTFSATPPSNPSSGDFYYKLDSSAKTATLMKYNGSSWAAASGGDLPQLTYEWYRRDANGNILDSETPYATDKVLYLDKTVVNGKVLFTCKVTK